MITINVFLKIKEAHRQDYLDLITELVRGSKQEIGCQQYIHCENMEKSNEFVIVENWDSQASVDKHNQTAHFNKFIDVIDGYLAEELKIQVS